MYRPSMPRRVTYVNGALRWECQIEGTDVKVAGDTSSEAINRAWFVARRMDRGEYPMGTWEFVAGKSELFDVLE